MIDHPNLAALPDAARESLLAKLTLDEKDHIGWMWELWARPEQLPPPGDWRLWLICAGRGFGKTRAGAEWVREVARNDPDARIALVGASLAEVRAVMVEGESGILSICHPDHMPVFEPSLRRITWANGAQAFLYSAAEAESLRGPQHSHAWCDEIAKWEASGIRAMRTWDNLLLGMRAGEDARIVATTTPRAMPLLKRLLEESETGDEVVVTRGATDDNAANLPTAFLRAARAQFRGSSFARQELGGEMLAEADGALWNRALLERCRTHDGADTLRRVVVAVDPPASAHGDECGIVVAALCEDFTGLMPLDATCEEMLRPTREWVRLATHPVQTITRAEAVGADGARTLLPPEAYALDLDTDGGARFRLTRPVDAPRIAVRFTAGLVPEWALLPDSLRHGVLRLAAHAWRARDEEALHANPPASIVALWRPWRRVMLA